MGNGDLGEIIDWLFPSVLAMAEKAAESAPGQTRTSADVCASHAP